MKEPVGSEYAGAYDHLYRDKDYVEECELIERLLRTYGNGSIRSLLDLGCGTGNHALPLARRGYAVVGVHRSDAMLQSARKKAATQQNNGRSASMQVFAVFRLDIDLMRP